MTIYYESKIYKITSDQTNDIYIGSTTKSLNRRLSDHKYDYKRYLRGDYHYVTSFEISKYPDCKIELLELCNFETKEELRRREGEYIQNNNCVNKCVAGRTIKESSKKWRNENKNYISEYNKKWRNENKEYLNDYQKKYQDENKDKLNKKYVCLCGGKYTARNKSAHHKSKKHHIYKNKKIKDITKTILLIYKLSNIILYNNNHG